MQNMPSRNDITRWLRFAAAEVEQWGMVRPATQARLESVGVNVSGLERRLLDQKQEAA